MRSDKIEEKAHHSTTKPAACFCFSVSLSLFVLILSTPPFVSHQLCSDAWDIIIWLRMCWDKLCIRDKGQDE
uniref:Uncharacterized protein n=1 Tax=Manihot esculenta TaxID=3983 RepID=A0A2C9V4M6_MANES